MAGNRRVLLCLFAYDNLGTPVDPGGVANYFYQPIVRAKNIETPAKIEVWYQGDERSTPSRQIAANLNCEAFDLGAELESLPLPGGGFKEHHPLWERVVQNEIDIVVIVASTGLVESYTPQAVVSDQCLLRQIISFAPDGSAKLS